MSKRRKAERCPECGRSNQIMVYQSLRVKPLCADCYIAEKETRKQLVKRLPFMIDKQAPLGYNWVNNAYYKNQEKGKRWADWVFANLCGMTN